MEPSKTFIRTVQQDPDDPEQLLLDLGTDLCEYMGWEPGNTLEWTDLGDGTWSLMKKIEK